MRPCSVVSQFTMRLVSVSGRVRRMMPVADSIMRGRNMAHAMSISLSDCWLKPKAVATHRCRKSSRRKDGGAAIGGQMDLVPYLERRATAIEEDAALGTFARLLPDADAMARDDGAGEFVFHPTKAFAAADDEKVHRIGEPRWSFFAWVGVERGGFKFPLFQIGRRLGGDFEFRDGIMEFSTVEAMEGLHGEVRAAFGSAGDGGAITALGAFELIGPAHAAL